MTVINRAWPAAASLLMLAACNAQSGQAPGSTPAAPTTEAGDTSADQSLTSCGADKLASYIGVTMSDTVLAQIKATSGAKTIRVVGPRDMMTMDFRQDRLTISTGDDGKIKTLRCV